MFATFDPAARSGTVADAGAISTDAAAILAAAEVAEASADAGDPDAGCYAASNALLRGLHAGRADRQRDAAAEAVPQPPRSLEPLDFLAPWPASAQFSLSDVVFCDHGPAGRCLRCAGRQVPSVSGSAHGLYQQAFSGIAAFSRPSAEEARRYAVPQRSLAAGEVVFPAFAALLSSLNIVAADRLFDVGSGVGRAVVAFALLYPSCSAEGVEIRPPLHEDALAALARLPPDVQARLGLRCGDAFEGDWRGFSVFFVNSTGFDDALMQRAAAKLEAEAVAPGARVVTLSQPFPTGSVPSLRLVSETPYRMTWGNATAYVYQRGSR